MRAVALDMAYEQDTLEQGVAAVEAEFGVKVTVLNPSGPGGGWPVVDLEADTRTLLRALRNGWGMDNQQIVEEVQLVEGDAPDEVRTCTPDEVRKAIYWYLDNKMDPIADGPAHDRGH
jgi:hypothetical protein